MELIILGVFFLGVVLLFLDKRLQGARPEVGRVAFTILRKDPQPPLKEARVF